MKKILLVIGVLIGILSLMTTMAFATISVTLDQLLNTGATLQIDDKMFSNFTYSSTGYGGATAIPASGVRVTTIETAFDPGLQFQSSWSVSANQGLDSAIGFTVTVIPGGNAIKDVEASMSGYNAMPAGLVAVGETFASGGTSLGSLGLLSDGTTIDSAAVTLLSTVMSLDVLKDISVNGNYIAGGGNFATVSIVRDQFSEVPLPPSALLLGSGLLGLVGLGWRRRKS
jgi:hypothetical protein